MSKKSQQNDHTLQIQGKSIPYSIVTSAKATKIRIDADPDGIRVVVPENHPADPHEFVREKSDWIREKHEKFERYRERIPDRSFEEGETFPFLGEERTVRTGDRAYSKLTDHHFVLASERVRDSFLKEELEHLYRREARKVYEDLVQTYADRMDVEHGTIAVRDQKTRWGSCSSKNTLSFNWRLIMAPRDIVEYVVIHELSHLEERNHTRQFWRIVSEYDPDYKDHAEWLKENSALLVFDPP